MMPIKTRLTTKGFEEYLEKLKLFYKRKLTMLKFQLFMKVQDMKLN